MHQDLYLSYQQYTKQLNLGHLKINFLQKSILVLVFFFMIPFALLAVFLKKYSNKKLYIFSFGEQEPIKSMMLALQKMENTSIILYPKSLPILPTILIKDFVNALIRQPFWTLKNLDFFGALTIKISKYYGLKVKYNISTLLVFQEYSFYSSYLTRVFEEEGGGLYNLMHGVPGKEAGYFRFTKCFVWGEYFKQYYIKNYAPKEQFIISGSIYHEQLQEKIEPKLATYEILYILQGDKYSDIKDTKIMLKTLLRVQKNTNIHIAVKPHPIYKTNINIPSEFFILEVSPIDSLRLTRIVLGHFTTMLLDAKVLNKRVLAFLPEVKKELVMYLHDDEIIVDEDELYNKIMSLLEMDRSRDTLSKKIIDVNIDTVKTIENELNFKENI